MNRLASVALASAFFAATSVAALAAVPPSNASGATPNGPAVSTKSPADQKAVKAAARLDRADPREARMTRALNLLEAKGYGDFSGFKQAGTEFAATVMRNGKQTVVTVNPDSDQVTPQG